MKLRHGLFVALAGLLLAADDAKEADAKKDMEKLQGTWAMASLEFNGTQLPEDALSRFKLQVSADRWTVTIDGQETEATFKLDTTKKPKAIDFTYTDGPNKGKTVAAIYLLEGDKVKLCRYVEPDKDRPTEFGTKGESGLVLAVWKREKS